MLEWNRKVTDRVADTWIKDREIGEENRSLIRWGENAVYQVGNYVVRVHRPGKVKEQIVNEVGMTGYLSERGLNCPRPSEGFGENPLEVDGYVVTVWDRIENEGEVVEDWYVYGKLMREFHELAKGYDGELEEFDPFEKVKRRLEGLENVEGLEKERKVFKDKKEQLEKYFNDNMRNVDEVLHGDANRGNVLVSEGDLFLLDFENISNGCKEWDLIPMVVHLNRFGLDEKDYEEFCKGYGFDVRDWEHVEKAVKIRELTMMTWMAQNVADDRVKEEFDKRMDSWITGSNAKWSVL